MNSASWNSEKGIHQGIPGARGGASGSNIIPPKIRVSGIGQFFMVIPNLRSDPVVPNQGVAGNFGGTLTVPCVKADHFSVK
jgi:hypothetical protein